MAQLQRLQAARAGHSVPPPIMLDLSIDVGDHPSVERYSGFVSQDPIASYTVAAEPPGDAVPTKKDSDATPTPPANEPPRPGFADRVIRPVFKTFAHTADVLTRDMPRWLRPVARTGLFVGMLLFIVVTIPLTPLFRKQHRRFVREWESETRPVYELRLRAHRIWVEECPHAAADHIRSVFDRARASPVGVEIPPYGRFAGVMCMHDLASAAYEFELSVGRATEAMEIAEFMRGQHTSDIGLGPTWIVSKAKCLVRLGRAPEAKALLLAHRDVYDTNAEVNRYLDELRTSGV